MEPGSGGGSFTGQPHRFANSGSSPVRYLTLGAVSSGGGAFCMATGSTVAATGLVAEGAGGGIAGAAGATVSLGADSALSKAPRLSFAPTARARAKAKTVAGKRANLRINQGKYGCLTNCSLDGIEGKLGGWRCGPVRSLP